ncbi:MAG: aminodeoxychorismate synthase component I [Bacteroidetes bacterium]|nr:aminodeoxychorismate synthase component I [Bacteroidota bacterium]MBL7105404.1 aminodeoxychorismate synthase component I [Bacteroidales bacterium]
MQPVKDIINLMNEYGKSSIPFVFIFDFGMEKPLIFRISELEDNNIFFDINGIKNFHQAYPLSKKIILRKYPVKFERYKSAFENVLKHINFGNSYLLNLTFPTKIEINLTLKEIFLHSTAKYKLYFMDKFVVFSPEIFVQVKNGKISSFPMKGTIDANIENAEQLILNNKKETAEHNTIVDLIRNDLSMVAKNVRVEKFRYIDKIKTHEKELLQTSSKITGELPDNWKEKIGDIFMPLLPAGSISGAPKKKTVDIIKESEVYNRGYFTGVFGYFDGEKLDSAVMIRFIEIIGDEIYFKSGGGITCFSNCESEYNEMIDKVYVPVV